MTTEIDDDYNRSHGDKEQTASTPNLISESTNNLRDRRLLGQYHNIQLSVEVTVVSYDNHFYLGPYKV
uniref:Uncharacterized protein n=1 Tax=Romanomermis culicivorax TaxID=13658 RepID=A0A915KRF2_ROMCU